MRLKGIAFIAMLMLVAGAMHAQVALEVAKIDGEFTIYPLIKKGDVPNSEDISGGIYSSNLHHPTAEDLRDPVYVEFLLNQISLFKSEGEFEVLYLIPENEVETIVVCKLNEKLGYLRLIRISERFD